MPRPKKPVTAPRKKPLQARSSQLVQDILKAAIRVLEKEGAARFTTIRVAEAAGVSVGSLYQYFPNKQSILYRLQVEEWAQTGRMIDEILGDTSRPPRARLRAMVRAFFVSECEEAPLRKALDATAPSYHDAPESNAHRQHSRKVAEAFLMEAAPSASARERRFAVDLCIMTMTAVGKSVSERSPSTSELHHFADAVSEMLWLHVSSLRAAPR